MGDYKNTVRDDKENINSIDIIGFNEPVEIDYSIHKKILITGAYSYIGESFEKYVKNKYTDNFDIDTIDLISRDWKKVDFSQYDAVLHVAGIAHADVENVSEEIKKKYYSVNTDLAVEIAQKAKRDGIKQFVFMSSMIIYGESARYGQKRMITRNTVPAPINFYGDSKWQADRKIRLLANDNFNVTIVRPPMIYGKGSKGNYPTLSKLAKKLPIIPKVQNERSMLYIDNLCEFLCQILLIGKGGIFIPQNDEYTKTNEMIKEIAAVSGKKVFETRLLTPCIIVGSKMPGKIGKLVNKAFGNMTYSQDMSVYPGMDYQVVGFRESIVRTEGEEKALNSHPKALMLASVASMIDLFNADNINILLKLGYDVDVATNFEFGSITSQKRVNEYKQELMDRGIGVYNIPIPRKLNKINTSYIIVKKLVDEKKYQIVHCHSPIGGVICRIACRNARKRCGTKVIYTAHGFHFFKGASKMAWAVFYPIEKICSHYTDILITINQEDYTNAQKFYAKRVEYVPGIGVHTNEFRIVDVDRSSKRAEFGFSEQDFVFMSTGQISVRKNHEVAIRALAKIDNANVKYLIVGFGEFEDKLKKIAEELGLKSRVVFAGYRGDVKELLHIADAYIFPSLQEGLPAALMEAMSVGLPVVCSRIRGNTDLIEGGKGGFIYDCFDIEGFAEGMKRIIAGAGKTMGATNIETMKKFDINTVNALMEKIYKSI